MLNFDDIITLRYKFTYLKKCSLKILFAFQAILDNMAICQREWSNFVLKVKILEGYV